MTYPTKHQEIVDKDERLQQLGPEFLLFSNFLFGFRSKGGVTSMSSCRCTITEERHSHQRLP
ncbi:unnamed protein product, partial [Ilex paraguariensis]